MVAEWSPKNFSTPSNPSTDTPKSPRIPQWYFTVVLYSDCIVGALTLTSSKIHACIYPQDCAKPCPLLSAVTYRGLAKVTQTWHFTANSRMLPPSAQPQCISPHHLNTNTSSPTTSTPILPQIPSFQEIFASAVIVPFHLVWFSFCTVNFQPHGCLIMNKSFIIITNIF